MVESLRRSLEQLEPPTCPNCHIDMQWYRSFLISKQPTVINHFFACPNCHGISQKTSTDTERHKIPPEKLSLPFERSACEAA
jgi:hypothetical protein